MPTQMYPVKLSAIVEGRKTYHYTKRLKEFMSTNNAEIMDLRDLRLSG